mgnify:CR=1 FL=1
MEPYLKWLPPQLRQVIEELGAAAALDLTFDLTKPYIADYFLQEYVDIVPYLSIYHSLSNLPFDFEFRLRFRFDARYFWFLISIMCTTHNLNRFDLI